MIYFLGIIGPIKILTFGIIFLIQFISQIQIVLDLTHYISYHERGLEI